MSFDIDYLTRRDAYLAFIKKLHRYPFRQIVLRLRTPTEPLVFPSDQSLLICQVAVPPQDHGPDDELTLIVGDRMVYSSPVRYLIDSYPLPPEPSSEDEVPTPAELHEARWEDGHLGVKVEILVPPRSSYQAVTKVMRPPAHGMYMLGQDAGTPIDVYLGCCFSRDVA